MNEILKTEDFVVYDNVLSQENYKNIWRHFQGEKYSHVHLNGWMQVWRATDGAPLKGQSYTNDKLPYNNYIDYIFNIFIEVAKVNNKMLEGWKSLSISPYLYSRETKLNWHNDAKYLGAIIFYVHPYWASTWGGELMLAKTPKVDDVPNPCLDHSFEDKLLEAYGYGQYITCKPNRIVLSKKGIWHSINRVDKDAGDHARASLVGFFT